MRVLYGIPIFAITEERAEYVREPPEIFAASTRSSSDSTASRAFSPLDQLILGWDWLSGASAEM
jgi:hypothetical protein